MKLIFTEEEVQILLLEWAADKYGGGMFNKVAFHTYSSDFATMSYEPPADTGIPDTAKFKKAPA